MRGTLVIDGNVDTTSIETVYKLLEQLVKSEELLRDANARFTRFSDRYQNPVGPSQSVGLKWQFFSSRRSVAPSIDIFFPQILAYKTIRCLKSSSSCRN